MRQILIITLFICSCLSFTSCQDTVNQYTVINQCTKNKRTSSGITRTQLEVDIYGLGPKKSAIVFKEISLRGAFKSSQDFESRMRGKLSNKMIQRILENYIF